MGAPAQVVTFLTTEVGHRVEMGNALPKAISRGFHVVLFSWGNHRKTIGKC